MREETRDRVYRAFWGVSSVFAAMVGAAHAAAPSQVALDGSFGKSGAIQPASGNYLIPAMSGKQAGSNLFFSFSAFSLGAGETATFSGPGSVKNVLARVTGGSPSTINGKLSCTIPAANFYLINSAGIAFGPTATLDVQGSFIVTTATNVTLADGHVFSATPGPNDLTLTTSNPASFGFLTSAAAAISMNGTLLAVGRAGAGKVLSVVGGKTTLTGTTLSAPDGGVNVVAVGSAGTITADFTNPLSPVQLQNFSAMEDVLLAASSSVDASGNAGGRVLVRSRSLTLSQSTISSDGAFSGAGLGIDLQLTGDLSLNASSRITARASAAAIGSSIQIKASNVSLDGQDSGLPTSILAQAQGDGPAGNIVIQADDMKVLRGATVTDMTSARGNAGSIYITADDLLIGQGTHYHTEIASGTTSPSSGAGNAGSVNMNVQTLEMLDGRIDDQSNSSGNGGDVNITASGSVFMKETVSVNLAAEDNSLPTRTGISTRTTGGIGGNINIHAASLALRGGAQIDLTTNAPSQGGNASIVANQIVLDGLEQTDVRQLSPIPLRSATGTTVMLTLCDTTSIETNSYGTGSNGNITVTADTLRIRDNAYISDSTYYSGRGGDITIQCPSIEISRANSPFLTGILAVSSGQAGAGTSLKSGDGGAIDIDARGGTVSVTNGGVISADSFGSGDGGSLSITADRLLLANGVGTVAGLAVETRLEQLVLPDGRVVVGGKGGTLQIDVGELDVTDNALISASSEGTGNAGDVRITTGKLLMAHDGLIASRSVSTGNAGNVSIDATAASSGANGSISVTGGSLITTASLSTSPKVNAGNVTVEARGAITLHSGHITAQTAGIGGTVTVESARSNVIIDHSTVVAQAGLQGNINLSAAGLMLVQQSTINASAQMKGGVISIDPAYVILNQSTIDGRARGKDVRVQVTPGVTFLCSGDSRILSNNLSLPPQTDVAGFLIALPDTVPRIDLGLAPVCAPHMESNFSSFIITGQGGRPPRPGGWLPDLLIAE